MPVTGDEVPTLEQIKALAEKIPQLRISHIDPISQTDSQGFLLQFYVTTAEYAQDNRKVNSSLILKCGPQLEFNDGRLNPKVASDADFKAYMGIS